MKRSAFAKIATLALALVLVLSLAACGKKSDSGVKILVPNDTTNEARALPKTTNNISISFTKINGAASPPKP